MTGPEFDDRLNPRISYVILGAIRRYPQHVQDQFEAALRTVGGVTLRTEDDNLVIKVDGKDIATVPWDDLVCGLEDE